MTSILSKAVEAGSADAIAIGARAGLVRNVRLQQLRGFAALAVLLYHVSSYVKDATGDARFLGVFSGYWGVYGVAIFFVLSGYLMAQLIRRDEPLRFLLDRILRIYPLLLIILAVALLAFYIGGYGRRPDFVAISLIPAGPRDYFLGVEWTLLFEMTYYVIIAALAMLGLRRAIEPLFAAWLGVLLVISLVGLAPAEIQTPTLTQLAGQSANCAFLMGFLLPVVLRARWLPSSLALALIALAIVALAQFIPGLDPRWSAALSASCLVAAAVRAPDINPSGMLDRFGLRLGDASYALYLCHVPIFILSGHFLPASVPALALWIGWAGAAIAAALCLGPLDLALHRRLKRWAARLPHGRVALLSLAFLAAFVGVAGFFDVQSRMNQWAQDKARKALAQSEAKTYPSVRTAIESTAIMPDGRLNVRGYGIDLDVPDDDGHIAITQGGRVIAVDRMRRLMPAMARELQRPDLRSIRFGFSLVSPETFDCGRGPLQASFVFPDGRVSPVTGPALGSVCTGSPATPKP